MRKVLVAGGLALLLAGCGSSGLLNRDRPDEFAVARQAPLVIPPDYSLVPPQPGAAATQNVNTQGQTLEALFGGQVARSQAETGALSQAGAATADAGVRSSVGDPQTNVVDKGATTRDIVAAPEGDGQDARAAAGAQATTQPQQPQ
ncbi:DUF3035 domain-containing protein [Sphingomonas lenta]|uniref:DUF3035 domain-containing protein n=1 Tax=Sphingomonas lenta TaxID=1141887 RepID=A0A2A2SD23_9SPHN|nr:DUF3035 domain-containing protein [Sphingomonas lenta]PAX07148.1 hypothetical protein CKY28_13990 [Sphingomonas lenta]